jgi:hypothetical protein
VDDPRRDHPIAPPAAVNGQSEAADQPEGVATAALQEVAATLPVLSGEVEREASPAEACRAFRNQDIARLCGIRNPLIRILVIVCKFV